MYLLISRRIINVLELKQIAMDKVPPRSVKVVQMETLPLRQQVLVSFPIIE